MSFSSDIKQALAATVPQASCCRAALLYGLLECGRGFSALDISLQTEHPAVANLTETLFAEQCRVPIEREQGRFVILSVEATHRAAVLHRFGHREDDVSIRLNRGNFDCEQCAAAYLRGVFLACGAVSDPNADYHLELNVPSYTLSRDVQLLLSEEGLPPKTLRRKGDYVLYYKDSEQIEDWLTLIGAASASLEMMNVKIVKNIRNSVNRVNNCENANQDKAIAAGARQAEAIRRIERHGGLTQLPEELRPLARLRMENPDLSLRELGQALEPPLSRSGVCHRLARICRFAEDFS